MLSLEDINDIRFEFWFDCCKFYMFLSLEEVWVFIVDIVGDVYCFMVSINVFV